MGVKGGSRTVLCVDDYGVGIELRKRMLEKMGFRVLAAASVSQALEIFRANQVDVVLTEHGELTIGGDSTLVATMKALKPEVPVAILTAETSLAPEEMSLADAVIPKLVGPDELLHIIEKLLRPNNKGHAATP